MKAYQIQTADGIDGLKLVDLPDPQPGIGQILIRVRATSLNYCDTAVVSGRYPGQTLPVIPLSDGVGEVVAIGEGVHPRQSRRSRCWHLFHGRGCS
ncbi:MAG: alcohol dehydrogenase catalytic domain-containing protein [Synechococcales bacterium]|nr:alcohol dehydrogenase catalytic domain-containing protein [Synechococcales bacterium]